MKLQRRRFLTAIGMGAGSVSIAKPATAQSMPNIKWRLARPEFVCNLATREDEHDLRRIPAWR
jgi:hypothetical protein